MDVTANMLIVLETAQRTCFSYLNLSPDSRGSQIKRHREQRQQLGQAGRHLALIILLASTRVSIWKSSYPSFSLRREGERETERDGGFPRDWLLSCLSQSPDES